MTLEHWDAQIKKYLLYRDPKNHEIDCENFPFHKIPRKVFLDTNVINLLVKHSDAIFEFGSIEVNGRNITDDIEALRHIFHVGGRANWNVVSSRKMLEEIFKTPSDDVRQELVDCAINFVNFGSVEDEEFVVNFGRRLVDSDSVSAMPDKADRELLGNAIGYGCDVFCTRDRKTIINKRAMLRDIPLRILTPVEWWTHIKPWAGLWV